MSATIIGLLVRNDNYNDRRNVNANYNPDNRFGMTPKTGAVLKTYSGLFDELCSHENLLKAHLKARKGKRKNPNVIEFEKDQTNNLFKIQWELRTRTYEPGPLKIFTVRDPKTRKISASPYPDRIVHHALINTIGSIFESRLIHDTFANRKKKGTRGAIERFDSFLRKCGRNNTKEVYALKADIWHYFDTIDHQIVLSLLKRRIKDEGIIWLAELILKNHRTEETRKGMPLGNLTSQTIANLYLGELDHFVKWELRAKYYIRYVDDFVLLSTNQEELREWRERIEIFLRERMLLKLHPQKTKIVRMNSGITFLGLRIFPHFKLLKKSNYRRLWRKMEQFKRNQHSFSGWEGYARMASTYGLRNKIRKELGAQNFIA